MSIVEELKAEAAKLLKEAELVEKTVVGGVEQAVGVIAESPVKVEADVKADVAKAETAVTSDVKAEETKVEADVKTDITEVDNTAKAVVKDAKTVVIKGQEYLADGLTKVWKSL